MAIRKERLRRLKEAAENLPPPPYRACGDVIKTILVLEGGWHLFEGCEPCSTCDDRSLDYCEPEAEHLSRGPVRRLYYSCPPEAPFPVPNLKKLSSKDVL